VIDAVEAEQVHGDLRTNLGAPFRLEDRFLEHDLPDTFARGGHRWWPGLSLTRSP